MIITKIISTVFVGLLLSIGLCAACYILLMKMYPRYSLQMRHHLFSLLVIIATFVLYCSFSSTSATISGIEQTLSSVKEVIVEKSDVIDNITGILSTSASQQATIDETNKSISSILSTNAELSDYIKDVNFSKINTESIGRILSVENMSVKEKSIQVVDSLFDAYIGGFTKTLKNLWWWLLIGMIILQLTYWGVMLYKAENGSRRNHLDKSQLRYNRKTADYRAKRHRR